MDGTSRGLLIVATTAVALITLWFQVSSLIFRYPLDYGEAATVDMSMRMLRGMTIYPPDLSKPDYIIANYPPLFMLAQAPLIGLFSPGFWQGRLISILCTWTAAYYLARIIHHHFKDLFAAVMTGMIFMAWPFVLMWSALARIDCLALALGLAALFYLSRRDLGWKHFWAGAALLFGAIYTRQSYLLAIPAAAFCWLLFQDWRRAFLLAGAVGSTTLAIFLLLNFVTQGGFLLHVITVNLNAFSVDQVKYHLRNDMISLAWILGLMSLSAIVVTRNIKILIAGFLIGAGLSALTIGKAGSNFNYFLELCAALSLASGALVAWSRQQAHRKNLQALLMLAMVAQTGIFLNRSFNQPILWARGRFESVADLRKMEALIQAAGGISIGDEYMGMCTLHNQLLYIQPFASAQAAYDGIWDQTDFIASIKAKKFSVITIYGAPGASLIKTRWTDAMLAAIEENYTVTDTLADTRVFQPFNHAAAGREPHLASATTARNRPVR
jgi:4-amino-4-deoxy-L-arabinose transferase-like glycosyltransferase